MRAAEILTAVRASGATLRVEGDSLVASNASKLAPDIKAYIRENKPEIIAALRGLVCAQCGGGGDLWHLDTPKGPALVHQECARFLPRPEPAEPSAAYQAVSAEPDGAACRVEIVELPPAGGRYRKVFAFLLLKPPAYVPEGRWRQCVEDGRAFLEQWGQQAQALNWSSADLFGLIEIPEHPSPSFNRLSRYDRLGLCWLLQGRRVTALTADTAAISNPATGSATNFRKNNRPAYGPLGRQLGRALSGLSNDLGGIIT
jgi:hypothetical protein